MRLNSASIPSRTRRLNSPIPTALSMSRSIISLSVSTDACASRASRCERSLVRLDKVDAREAGATMEDDKRDILAEIESTVGLDEFNKRVRAGLKQEYKQLSTRAGFR